MAIKIIDTELQTAASADTQDSGFPASNVLTDVTAERYQNTAGDNTATLTISASAGGADTFGVAYTNATSIVWTAKNGAGASVGTGTINLTSPRSVDRVWQEFTAQAGACSVELACTAPAGTTLYLGAVRVGKRFSISGAIESLDEDMIDHSIRVPLSAPGAEYIELLRMLRSFSLTVRESQSVWYAFRAIYRTHGPTPLFILLSDEFGTTENNENTIFGKIDIPPKSKYTRGGGQVYTTINILEAG